MRAAKRTCVVIDVGGEDLKGFFPSLSDPRMLKAIRKLNTSRMRIRRGNAVDQTIGAREEFFDTMCQGLEIYEVPDPNGENGEGEYVDVCSLDGWHSLIPVNYKSSFAAYFEEKSALSEEDRGN